MKKVFKIVIMSCLLITMFTVGHFAIADTTASSTYSLLAPIPTASGTSTVVDTTNIGPYVQIIVELFVSLAAVIAVFMIVYGGILTMSTDNFENKKDGKAIIYRTLMGFLLVIVAYLILSAINPNFLSLNAFSKIPNFTGVNISATPSGPGTTNGGVTMTPTTPGCYEKTITTVNAGTSGSTNSVTYSSTPCTSDGTTCASTFDLNSGNSCVVIPQNDPNSQYQLTYMIQTYYGPLSRIQTANNNAAGYDQNIYDHGGCGPGLTKSQTWPTNEASQCRIQAQALTSGGYNCSGNGGNHSLVVTITSNCAVVAANSNDGGSNGDNTTNTAEN